MGRGKNDCGEGLIAKFYAFGDIDDENGANPDEVEFASFPATKETCGQTR